MTFDYTGAEYTNFKFNAVNKCTERDWQRLWNPSEGSKSVIEELKARDVMYCLTDTDLEGQKLNMKMYGPLTGPTHKIVIA